MRLVTIYTVALVLSLASCSSHRKIQATASLGTVRHGAAKDVQTDSAAVNLMSSLAMSFDGLEVYYIPSDSGLPEILPMMGKGLLNYREKDSKSQPPAHGIIALKARRATVGATQNVKAEQKALVASESSQHLSHNEASESKEQEEKTKVYEPPDSTVTAVVVVLVLIVVATTVAIRIYVRFHKQEVVK